MPHRERVYHVGEQGLLDNVDGSVIDYIEKYSTNLSRVDVLVDGKEGS